MILAAHRADQIYDLEMQGRTESEGKDASHGTREARGSQSKQAKNASTLQARDRNFCACNDTVLPIKRKAGAKVTPWIHGSTVFLLCHTLSIRQ